MALFTKLLLPLFLFLALASCRSLSLPTILQTRDIDSDIATRQPTDDTLTINFSAAPSLAGTPSLELIAARRALQKLKSLLGPDALKTLVAEDIAAGNAAWHDILGRSSGDNDTSQDPGNRVLAEVQFTAVPQECAHGSHNPAVNFTAANFLGWFTDSAFNHVDKLWAGHPEHYYVVIMKNGDGTLGAELVEPWGPVLTNSKVPRLAAVTGQPGGGIKKPWMKARTEFPYQTVGEETLVDGSGKVVGYLHYSFRNLPVQGKGHNGQTCGIEVALNMWMPSATPADVKDGISEHLAVEYFNWVSEAYGDIKSGAFVPV